MPVARIGILHVNTNKLSNTMNYPNEVSLNNRHSWKAACLIYTKPRILLNYSITVTLCERMFFYALV